MYHANISLKPTVAVVLLLGALAGCSRQEPAPAAAPAASATKPATADIPAAAAPAVAPTVQALSAEQLHERASKALAENRIYAPGGDNAMEYYLALRDKQPSDAAVASALTDLMPYTVIAVEQSIARDDFAEAGRLAALIARADPAAPALPRLKQSIASAQQAAAKREETDQAKAKSEAEAKAREQERQTAQAAQQRAAAEALAAQQAAAPREEAPRPAQPAPAPAQAAAERPAAPTPTPQAPAPALPAAPPPSALRVVAAPAPRYPAEALRAGTSGEVLVEITVGVDGSVTNARVVRAQPARIFDREAINAVRRWKFEPLDSPVTTRRTIAFSSGG